MQQEEVEEEYEVLDPEEHVRKRPDTYVGSLVMEIKECMIVIFGENNQFMIDTKDIEFVEGLERIFLEILSNAADNARRSRELGIPVGKMKVVVTSTSVTIYNEGRPISCGMHTKQRVPRPQLIFSHLRAGSNFSDLTEKKYAGRNGFGAKLTAIFSHEMTVRLANMEENCTYEQSYTEHLKKISEPKYGKPNHDQSYTEITYKPDFRDFYANRNNEIFHITRMIKNDDGSQSLEEGAPLTDDPTHCPRCWDHNNGNATHGFFSEQFIGLMARLSLDFAFNCNVPIQFVYKNHNIMFDITKPIDLAGIYYPEIVNIKSEPIVYESQDGDTRVLILDTPHNGNVISFANGMPTREGGIHVDEWIKAVSRKSKEDIERKTSVKLNVGDIKRHVTAFISVYVRLPQFSGQTKERLKGPKPKVYVTEEMQKTFASWGACEALLKSMQQRRTNKIAKATDGKKVDFVSVKDADDAGWAGTDKSIDCTLYVVEGLSAKSFWVRGLKYYPMQNPRNTLGCYPLRGKMLNPKKKTDEQIIKNKVLNDLKIMLGLKEKLDYSDVRNRRKLRYGKVVICADADPDGTHIKGLVINFLAGFEGLLESQFADAIVTPVMICTKGKAIFKHYSMSEYEKWKKITPDYSSYSHDYFKGLGSAKDNMIKDAFATPRMQRFQCNADDQEVLEVAFGATGAPARRELYRMLVKVSAEHRLDAIRISRIEDLIYEELILFAIMANRRAIPMLSDGLKDSQRRVVYTALKAKKKFQGVEEFQADVKKTTHYRHGPDSLRQVVVAMAGSYPGGNNVPMLQGEGNFGSRISLGKDASAPRYTSCRPHPILPYLFRAEDNVLLKYEYEESKVIGVHTFYPILPIMMMNGTSGTGWGWSTNCPSYNPMQLIAFVRYYVQHMKDTRGHKRFNPPDLVPWWRGYTGSIFRKPNFKICNRGIFEDKNAACYIRELPIMTSGSAYEKKLNEMVKKGRIRMWKPITLDENCPQYRLEGYEGNFTKHEELHLESSIPESNMHFMDENFIPRHFHFGPKQLMAQFCKIRYAKYVDRKQKYIPKMEEDCRIMSLKIMFIEDVISERLVLRNRPKAEIMDYMDKKKYPKEFLKMTLMTITKEKADKLRKELEEKKAEIEDYKQTHPGDIWLKELDELCVQLEEHWPGQWGIHDGYGIRPEPKKRGPKPQPKEKK